MTSEERSFHFALSKAALPRETLQATPTKQNLSTSQRGTNKHPCRFRMGLVLKQRKNGLLSEPALLRNGHGHGGVAKKQTLFPLDFLDILF